ncbi:MAG: hypothetical protein AB7O97_22140 [Planctomycetota bacterium]
MSEMDERLKEQMARFEAARIGDGVALAPAAITAVLAVFDGTDQDATVRALAQAMAARTGAELRDVRPAAADALPEILAAAAGCQVVVAPSPFRRDYATEGQHSLSTTIDLLLAQSDAAVCLARAPVADADHAVSHPLVALQIDRHRKAAATAMALAFAQNGGELALLSVVDPQQGVHGEELLGRYLDPHDLSPEVLEGLASARAAALTAALQRNAEQWKVRPLVKFAIGDAVTTALELDRERQGLLVAGRERDARRDEAQQARRLVLGSRWPVLLV